MTQPPPYYPPPRRSNGLGIAGFIVSLVGLVLTLGLLSPIGLFLSFIALFRRPRGFAFAGFVVGLLGTALLAIWVSFFGLLGFSCFNISRPYIYTVIGMTQAQQEIEKFRSANGRLPDEAEGKALIDSMADGWQHRMRYEPSGMGFSIRSAGEDGLFHTRDDIRTE